MIAQIRSDHSDNYSYLVSGETSSGAVLVDPVAVRPIQEMLEREDLTPVTLINTHSHFDHVEGNRFFPCQSVLAHPRADIPGQTRGLEDGECLNLAEHRIQVLHTPGHVPDHIVLLVDNRVLISGDTLFLSGCGNPSFGGNAEALYRTFVEILDKLPGDIVLMSGHDYADKNLRFAKTVEPDNPAIDCKIGEVTQTHNDEKEPVSTMREEHEYNPFFRLESPSIRQTIGMDENTNSADVFLKLREMRSRF